MHINYNRINKTVREKLCMLYLFKVAHFFFWSWTPMSCRRVFFVTSIYNAMRYSIRCTHGLHVRTSTTLLDGARRCSLKLAILMVEPLQIYMQNKTNSWVRIWTMIVKCNYWINIEFRIQRCGAGKLTRARMHTQYTYRAHVSETFGQLRVLHDGIATELLLSCIKQQ